MHIHSCIHINVIVDSTLDIDMHTNFCLNYFPLCHMCYMENPYFSLNLKCSSRSHSFFLIAQKGPLTIYVSPWREEVECCP